MLPALTLTIVLATGLTAQRTDANRLRALVTEALRYRQAGEITVAFDRFTKILRLDPAYLPALAGAAEAAYASHNPLAGPLLTQLLAQSPAEPSAHAMLAVLSFESGDCRQAVFHFELSRAAFADRPDQQLRYASCLIELNRTNEAIDTLSAVHRSQPDDPVVRFDLALACSLLKQDARVVELLEADGKSDEEWQILRAGSLARLHRETEAVDSLRQAAARKPDSMPYRAALVNILLTANRPKEALAFAEGAVAQAPLQAIPYVLRGAALAELGQDGPAQLDFDRAVQMDSNSSAGPAAEAVFLLERATPAEAVKYLRAQLAGNPGNPELSYLLAKALDRTETSSGLVREAVTLLNACLAARPEMADAQALLGKFYLKQGSLSLARTALQTAIALDPANRPAINRLLHLYRDLGLADQAAELTTRLRKLVAVLSTPGSQMRVPE